jgi:hypothetical protein
MTGAIFRLTRGSKRDPAVKIWFEEEPPPLRKISIAWFARMRQCGNDVLEQVHDGCPVACIDDAPFAYVNAFSSHVNVGFFYGAELDDPSGLLDGHGKRMRHVKLHPGREVDAGALGKLIDAAYADIKARLAADRD